MKIYKGPGKYVAICNNTNFDGHYIKTFEVPENDPYSDGQGYSAEEMKTVEAGWYFLNRLDFVACLEAVYPLEIFESLKDLP